MKLTKIVIDDYNSIKDPQTIDINGGITTFLGKNGSGKSNLLRAIRLFFNSSEFLGYQREASYHAFLELHEQELRELDASLTTTPENKIVEVAFHLNEVNRKKIVSHAANTAIRRVKEEIFRIHDVLIHHVQEYKEQLSLLQIPVDLQRTDTLSHTLGFDGGIVVKQEKRLEKLLRHLEQDVFAIQKYLDSMMTNDAIYLQDNAVPLQFNHAIYHESIQIQYHKITLSPLEKKFVTIDFEKLRKEVKKINVILAKLTSKIDNELAYFSHLSTQLEQIICHNKEQKSVSNGTTKHGFLQRIQGTLHKRCFYLDNEQSLMFQHRIQKDLSYQGFQPRQNLIMDSFFHYCLERKIVSVDEGGIQLKNYNQMKKKKMLEHFKQFINDSLPRFESDMLDTIDVELQQDQFRLFVIEKSGDRIDFDDTSLGRRWYFTYLFIKKVLKKGDVFLIDEPASFLHPEAQKTILRELEELARNGILIFLTTHSPYMISHDYSSIYFVSMTSRGTIIEKGENQNYSLLKDTLGEVGFNNLLLNLSKKFIIVEGPGDLACFKTFIRLFGLDENKYEVWYLEGAYNIRRIKRFLENNRVNSVHVLDADMKKNYKYAPDDVVFVGEDTKEKSIEGLFHPKDRIRYFKKGKLSHDKIVSATIDTVEKETLEQFRSLFFKLGILDESKK